MENISKLLSKTQQEFEQEQKQLAERFARRKAGLLKGVRTEVAGAFDAALEIFNAIPAADRNGILSESPVKETLKALGLVTKAKAVKAVKGPRVKFDEDALLTFLLEEHSGKEIQEKFGLSSARASQILGALEKAKKVKCVRKIGAVKIWVCLLKP
jgi:hypothetical protein